MNSELIRVGIFSLIGVWNTLFDLSIFVTLLKTLGKLPIWKTSAVKAATVFHVCSFLIANLVSYTLNSTFTFNTGKSRGFVAYFIVTLVALGISTLFIQYFNQPKFSTWFSNHILPAVKKVPIIGSLKMTDQGWAILLKLGSVALSMVVNYLGYRNLVFVGI
jgi:putative flippase GtrA